MLSEELLLGLNEYEIIDIANSLNLDLKIKGTNPRNKSKLELVLEILKNISASKPNEQKDIIKSITSTGRFIFTAYRTTKLKVSVDFKIPKNYSKYQDFTSKIDYFFPDNIDDMINSFFIIIPHGTNHIIIIKKDFGENMNMKDVLSMAKYVCQDMKIESLFKSDIVKNIFSKVANIKLNTKVIISINRSKKFRVFYDQHKCDGDFLTISTRVSSGRPRISKVIKNLSSIEQPDADSLVKSKRINSLITTPDIIDYAIVKTPECVRNTLDNVSVNILVDTIKGGKPTRYKLQIHQQNIKILTVDTEFNDIKEIVDIILQIH